MSLVTVILVAVLCLYIGAGLASIGARRRARRRYFEGRTGLLLLERTLRLWSDHEARMRGRRTVHALVRETEPWSLQPQVFQFGQPQVFIEGKHVPEVVEVIVR